MIENFEESPLLLTFSGDWSVSSDKFYEGTQSYKSAQPQNGQSIATTTIHGGEKGALFSLEYYISFDGSPGITTFYLQLDHAMIFPSNSGFNTWLKFNEFFISPGEHTLELVFLCTTGTGKNYVCVDALEIDEAKSVYKEDGIMDLLRIVSGKTNIKAETLRNVIDAESTHIDLYRQIIAPVEFLAETIRRIPVILSVNNAPVKKSPTGVKSIAVTMESKTLSDTFTVETTKPLQINDAVQGNFLDYAYNFLVEETSQQEDLQTITGMYDVDLMLCTPIIYTVPTAAKASKHAQAIADALGKNAEIRIDDFVSTADFSSVGATYKNIISSLFGWTSSLPQRQINVFLRGDRLYFIQRGKENERIEIIAPHSRPVIRRKIIRSMWASAAGNEIGTYAQSVIISPAPFSGTISFGDQSASYAGGLLMSEVHGNEVTTYSYSNGAISSKRRTSPKSTSETHYSYANTGNDRILATETETTMDLTVDPPTKSVKITRHVAIGHGFYGTTVEEDGEYKGATMGSGKPGGKASIFSINEANRSMGSGYSVADGKKLPGSSLIDTNFPVSGADTLRDLTDAIEWLNGKIEERVSMEVYNMDKVLDFTQKIIFQGNTYYLERNQLYKDPRVNKQSIELVRWY